MKRAVIAVSVVGIALLAGLLLYTGSGLHFLTAEAEAATATTAPATPQPEPTEVIYVPNRPPTTNLLFQRVPGPDVPTLQEMTAGATTDAEAYAKIVAYYAANKERLRALWQEDNPTRLAGIFSMYVVHISTVYGETTYPASFLEYLQQPRAHCGTYSIAQAHIAGALGLTWRMWELTSGWHGWVEILVDGQWEMFDATTNQWISRAGVELLQQVPREYRSFYTPLLDSTRPDARWHLEEGYNMIDFRVKLPGLGLFYNPPGEPFLSTLPELWDQPAATPAVTAAA